MNPGLLVLMPVLIINLVAKGVESIQDASAASHRRAIYMKAHPEAKHRRVIKPPRWGKRSIERFFREYEFRDGLWQKRLVPAEPLR